MRELLGEHEVDWIAKLPVWLSAIALSALAAGFVYVMLAKPERFDYLGLSFGVLKYDNAPSINESQLMILNDLPQVITKATEIIANSDEELWIAVDVVPYGAISAKDWYDSYKRALLTSEAKTKNIIWFSQDFEVRYTGIGQQFDLPNKYQDLIDDSIFIRKHLSEAIESRLITLAFNNMWLSKDSKGGYHVVICWFNLKQGVSSSMRGIYVNSKDVYELMTTVWAYWKEQTDRNMMDKLIQIWSID